MSGLLFAVRLIRSSSIAKSLSLICNQIAQSQVEIKRLAYISDHLEHLFALVLPGGDDRVERGVSNGVVSIANTLSDRFHRRLKRVYAKNEEHTTKRTPGGPQTDIVYTWISSPSCSRHSAFWREFFVFVPSNSNGNTFDAE